jgi:hypothetical protein
MSSFLILHWWNVLATEALADGNSKDNVPLQMAIVREAGLSTVVGGQLSECCTTAVPSHSG